MAGQIPYSNPSPVASHPQDGKTGDQPINHQRKGSQKMNLVQMIVIVALGIAAVINGVVALYSSYLPTTKEGFDADGQRRRAYAVSEANRTYEQCLKIYNKQSPVSYSEIPSSTGTAPTISVRESHIAVPNCEQALQMQLAAARTF